MKSSVFDDLKKSAVILQDILTAQDNPVQNESKPRDSYIGFTIRRTNSLVIKMDANKNHQRPHVHVDYGGDRHAASYAIDTAECLAGDDKKYSKQIQKWIIDNQDCLMQVWDITRTSPQPDDIVTKLKHTKF